MNTFGRHLIVEYWDCNCEVLNNLKLIQKCMLKAAKIANTHAVAHFFHPFETLGVSGAVIIEESHLTIHTWPEHGYAACDFYTCGEETFPELAMEFLSTCLQSKKNKVVLIERGTI